MAHFKEVLLYYPFYKKLVMKSFLYKNRVYIFFSFLLTYKIWFFIAKWLLFRLQPQIEQLTSM